MNGIRRYYTDNGTGCYIDLYDADDGEWVRYVDHLAAIQALEERHLEFNMKLAADVDMYRAAVEEKGEVIKTLASHLRGTCNCDHCESFLRSLGIEVE